MRHPTTLLLAALLLGAAPLASAQTMRCGNVLIREGQTLGYVFEKCGPPQFSTSIIDPVWARGLHGGTYVVGISGYEVWRYDRGWGKFPANLTFREGKLRRIEFERFGGD